jgi:hypothetical protein
MKHQNRWMEVYLERKEFSAMVCLFDASTHSLALSHDCGSEMTDWSNEQHVLHGGNGNTICSFIHFSRLDRCMVRTQQLSASLQKRFLIHHERKGKV